MPNPRPDFAQFADEYRAASKCAPQKPETYRLDDKVRSFNFATLLKAAERHARLLETIRKWADETVPEWRVQIPVGGEDGFELAKAHIRSLLEHGE